MKIRKIRTVCFYGSRNGNAKLTARQVRQIRKLYGHDGNTCPLLADKFSVGRQVVHDIIAHAIWKGVAV